MAPRYHTPVEKTWRCSRLWYQSITLGPFEPAGDKTMRRFDKFADNVCVSASARLFFFLSPLEKNKKKWQTFKCR